jgi:hypothetical protein
VLLSGALVIGERVELVDEPLRVDPTRRVLTDGELASVVTDDDVLTQEVMRLDAAP